MLTLLLEANIFLNIKENATDVHTAVENLWGYLKGMSTVWKME